MRLLIEAEDNQCYELLPDPHLPEDLIVEDQAYRLRLVADGDEDLAGCRLLLGDVDRGVGRYERRDQVSWTWTVSDYVGIVTVGVEKAGSVPLLPVQEVIVDPNRGKLTRDQFAAMVDDIAAKAVIAYSLSPATRRVKLGRRREAFNLAQLEYIRQQFDPLRQAIEAIARRPRRALIDRTEMVDLGRAQAPDDRSLHRLVGHPGELVPVAEPQAVPVGARRLHHSLNGHLPHRLQVSRRQLTYDVYENQLLKHFLTRLNVVLHHTQARLAEAAATSNQELDERVIRLVQRRQGELRRYQWLLYDLLDLGFLQEVSPLRRLKPVTPTLRKDPLYARFYALYRQFNRAITPFDGQPFLLSLERTWQLYEYWCFFQVTEALRLLVGSTPCFDARSMLQTHSDGISLALRQAEVTVTPQMKVFFQKTYGYYGWDGVRDVARVGAYSHEMRPDISIEIRDAEGRIKEIVLLDPKYRVSSQSLNQAMDELHRYKDALVGPKRQRLVGTALALCPSAARAKRLYFRGDYIHTHGLGALVLKPGDNKAVKSLASHLAGLGLVGVRP